MDQHQKFTEFFPDSDFFDFSDGPPSLSDDIFEALQSASNTNFPAIVDGYGEFSGFFQESNKRRKVESQTEAPRSHITVERNRRKQMNGHLSVLRSLMPCFYVKRGDQASIIGGVISYINELQQILHSLQAKKQRKSHMEVLSPRPVLSPRLSPRTPIPYQSKSLYWPSPYIHQSGGFPSPVDLSPCNSSTTSVMDSVNELAASSRSGIAEVDVKFSGSNLIVKTKSPRIGGQVVKIISALEQLALEILQVNINTVDDKIFYSFTIKIGIECQVSVEELAELIQQTFSVK